MLCFKWLKPTWDMLKTKTCEIRYNPKHLKTINLDKKIKDAGIKRKHPINLINFVK